MPPTTTSNETKADTNSNVLTPVVDSSGSPFDDMSADDKNKNESSAIDDISGMPPTTTSDEVKNGPVNDEISPVADLFTLPPELASEDKIKNENVVIDSIDEKRLPAIDDEHNKDPNSEMTSLINTPETTTKPSMPPPTVPDTEIEIDEEEPTERDSFRGRPPCNEFDFVEHDISPKRSKEDPAPDVVHGIDITDDYAINTDSIAKGSNNDDDDDDGKNVNRTNNDVNISLLVAEVDTIPTDVLWQPEYRGVTDVPCAVIFGLLYVAFVGLVIFTVLNANPKFEFDDDGNMRITDHHKDDLDRCCAERSGGSLFDLCDNYWNGDVDTNSTDPSNDTNSRRLYANSRRLYAVGHGLNGDEGIFEAFLQAPEIIAGLLGMVIILSILWAFLLQLFATPIVWATELIKIGLLIYMGVVSGTTPTLVTCCGLAFIQIVYDVVYRDKLNMAGRMLSQSSKALGKNKKVFIGVLVMVLLYVLNAWMFVLFYSKGYQQSKVELTSFCLNDRNFCNDLCIFKDAAYQETIYGFISFMFGWIVFLLASMRLSTIATIVGSWHFHLEDKPSVMRAVLNSTTRSLGTLSIAALFSTVADWVNRVLMRAWWRSWVGGMCCFTVPLQIFMCCCGAGIRLFVQMYSKFAVIVHSFTGLPFFKSGKQVVKILKRHFKGGFVTELTSESVLNLGSYVFSIGVMFAAWAWFDSKFKFDTLTPDNMFSWITFYIWVIIGLFSLWYPVLGIYVIIIINRLLQGWEATKIKQMGGKSLEFDTHESFLAMFVAPTQDIWLSPLAALFVGCVSMMFFSYLGGVFKDTISVMFMCYAIDKDNNVDLSTDAMHELVKAMGDDIVIAEPVTQDGYQMVNNPTTGEENA